MKKTLFTLALGALAAISATAAPLCNTTNGFLPTGPAATIAAYCDLGPLEFGLFSISGSGGAANAQVSIGTGSNFTNGVANLIFQINGVTATSGDLKIQYEVFGATTGITLNMGVATGLVTITELACKDGFACNNQLGTAQVISTGSHSASASFSSTNPVFILKDIQIGNAATLGTISDFTNGSVTPEPGSMALLGSGLIGLALAARRRLKK